MSEDRTKRGAQREFLFLFDSQASAAKKGISPICDKRDTRPSVTFNDRESAVLKKKLIEQLKEFGC